ncbi:ParB/RepB/Spo0J family partition protein [Nocardia sp. NBC_00511]|uniref:ParB/RepB/Spo0J family partition protein n=1 Tax=Nocardia sp. NBC_00511 TaxID=2903591 RepID=UPI002F90A297
MSTTTAPAAADTAVSVAEPATAPARRPDPKPLTAERLTELRAQLEASSTGRVPLAVDPEDLVFGRNIRSDAEDTLDEEFLASIREHGFHQEPKVFINRDGYLQVRFGHRRTLAARAVDYRPCPVILVAPPLGETAREQRIDDIGTQWDENERRTEMTDADRIGAVEEMLDLGLTPVKVEKRLKSVTRDEAAAIGRLRKATAADLGRAAALAGDLDISQAATVAELVPDEYEMGKLTEAAREGRFERTVIAVHHRRRALAATEAARESFVKKGYTILTSKPGYWDENKPDALESLVTHGGRPATVQDVTSPSHWAVLLHHAEQAILIETGEQISADSIDPATVLDPAATPAEGKHHADAVRYEPAVSASYFCTDRKGAGLKVSRTGGANPEQGAANVRARKANVAARVDTEARRKFITDKFLTRKTLPKGIIQWITHMVITDPEILTKGNGFAIEFFGLGNKGGYNLREKLTGLIGYDDTRAPDAQKTTDQRALIILAALAMAATEARMQPTDKQPHYWRATQDDPNVCYLPGSSGHARYLRLLAAIGHKPGPIERAVMGQISLTDAIAEAADLTA